MRVTDHSRHIVIAVTAAVAALAWAATPAGARSGWTAATDVLVLGQAAQFVQPPAPSPVAAIEDSPLATTAESTSAPSGGAGTSGGSGGSAGTPSPVSVPVVQNPNKAKNGTIIGIGKQPAATTAPTAAPTTAAPVVAAPTAAAPAPTTAPVTEPPAAAPVVESTVAAAPAVPAVTESPAA
ncbi:hypothetical protein [Dactylosporangium sp. NPDC051541]|uniref:hypothetical protein n=1 Tax=Dactylosporangium sp. NPDC051541 TaxID=3363977 RepID=UPI0037B84F85